MSRSARFRRLLASPDLEFLCEAHDGLSAKIVEEAGFRGIWGSGLAISSQLGVRDNNEASWTQVLDVLEFMADATTVPILMDGDTGFGNFNNVQRLVRKLEQRSVAAVCLEDKQFPKSNSFLDGHRQPLAPAEEFCGKVKAAKDAQTDPYFCVVARVEAFVAGWGLGEALKRAAAYHEAGADGILIHSTLSVPDEVLAFAKEWGGRCPLVLVPTKYYSTPVDVYRANGISMVIWANHVLRGSIAAMEEVARQLRADETPVRLEARIASLAEVFRLQGASDLEAAERRYLPGSRNRAQAVVLAASRGVEMGELTREVPKTMVRIGTRPLLGHIIATYNSAAVKDVTVVRGFGKESVDLPGARYVDNDRYEEGGELVSLKRGLESLSGEADAIVVSYGDVLFRRYILDLLLDQPDDLVVMVDTDWAESVNRGRACDTVRCSRRYSRRDYGGTVFLERIGPGLEPGETHGEWMGFLKISSAALGELRAVLNALLEESDGREATVPALLSRLVEQGRKVRVVYTTGNWLDIDSADDVARAELFG